MPLAQVLASVLHPKFDAVESRHPCSFKSKFCSSLCLTPAMLSSYVVFSFVRDPVERVRVLALSTPRFCSLDRAGRRRCLHAAPTRQKSLTQRCVVCAQFWSALATAATTRAPTLAPTRYADVVSMLEGMQHGRCSQGGGRGRFNVHLATQTLSLSTATSPSHVTHRPSERRPRWMLPIDYIGRVEHLQEDFQELLTLLHAVTGRQLSPARSAALNLTLGSKASVTARETASATTCAHKDKTGAWTRCTELRLRNATMDAVVRRTYAQDIACFA